MANYIFILGACCFLSFFNVISSQGSNSCNEAVSCGQCIQTDEYCAWCRQPEFEKISASRCGDIKKILRNCDNEFITFPEDYRNNTKDANLSKPQDKTVDKVQIKPQSIYLKLRPHSTHPFSMKYRQAEDYPVDLYYLMDLSNSMKDDKDKLAELGNLLAERMEKITTNFKLGFGSFVDKVVMPYTNTVPEKLKNPCPSCEAPYGFRNHMPLTSDTSRFATEVLSAPVSGNLDGPEGGFDAIMQSVVCPQIGWRPLARKLLVFSTDSSFHSAGDGKIGGIVKPNDGECHLDNGYYSESSNQDYPSLSQINHKVKDKDINIIFAVTANQVPIYAKVGQQIEGASSGELKNDSSNVVELVQNQYDLITTGVEFTHNAKPDLVDIEFYSKCLGKDVIKTKKCDGLKVGTEVDFEVKIKVKKCPENIADRKMNFSIYAIPLPSMEVILDIICDCDCESPEKKEIKSPKCNGRGTYQCGKCSCDEDISGDKCECNISLADSLDNSKCKLNLNSTHVCENRGTCICGECRCNIKENTAYTGTFCECDNNRCERSALGMCSGPENGKCVCGKCVCLHGRSGNACQCPDNKVCIENNSQLECSKNGHCDCGSCKCDEVYNAIGQKRPFTEEFCQSHPNFLLACPDFLPCIQCHAFQNGPLHDEDKECANCTNTIFIEIKDEIINDESNTLCLLGDGDDEECKIRYVYFFNGTDPVIHVQKKKDCTDSDALIVIVIGVIVGIVLIGLALLLIWKLLTTIHDRREFAKFENEAKSAKWDTGVNPLFKEATSTFKNPTYGGK